MRVRVWASLGICLLSSAAAMPSDSQVRPNQEIVALEKSIRDEIPLGTRCSDVIIRLGKFKPDFARVPDRNTLVVGFSRKPRLSIVESSLFLTLVFDANT